MFDYQRVMVIELFLLKIQCDRITYCMWCGRDGDSKLRTKTGVEHSQGDTFSLQSIWFTRGNRQVALERFYEHLEMTSTWRINHPTQQVFHDPKKKSPISRDLRFLGYNPTSHINT